MECSTAKEELRRKKARFTKETGSKEELMVREYLLIATVILILETGKMINTMVSVRNILITSKNHMLVNSLMVVNMAKEPSNIVMVASIKENGLLTKGMALGNTTMRKPTQPESVIGHMMWKINHSEINYWIS